MNPLALALLLLIEPASFQGEWALVQTADEKRAAQADGLVHMFVCGNTVTLKMMTQVMNTGTLKVGPFKTIDMTLSNGVAVHGTYCIQGDTLVLCVDDARRERPHSLVPTGPQWSEFWRRVRTK